VQETTIKATLEERLHFVRSFSRLLELLRGRPKRPLSKQKEVRPIEDIPLFASRPSKSSDFLIIRKKELNGSPPSAFILEASE